MSFQRARIHGGGDVFFVLRALLKGRVSLAAWFGKKLKRVMSGGSRLAPPAEAHRLAQPTVLWGRREVPRAAHLVRVTNHLRSVSPVKVEDLRPGAVEIALDDLRYERQPRLHTGASGMFIFPFFQGVGNPAAGAFRHSVTQGLCQPSSTGGETGVTLRRLALRAKINNYHLLRGEVRED